jgi:hypothetical protein
MCLHDNVSNILYQHVKQFGMNLMDVEYSKALLMLFSFFKCLKCIEYDIILNNNYSHFDILV